MEFGLVMICAIPMLFGMLAMGITLGRGVQAIQVTRDAGHMYGLGTDFSQAGAQGIMAKLAQDYSLNASTGNAVLIFSQIMKLSAAQCTAASISPCTNDGQTVFIHRWVIGNTTLRTSNFGTPPALYLNVKGMVAPVNYMQQPSLVATGFSTVLAQSGGDIAYVVEGFFRQPDLNFLQPGFSQANQGTYVRSIF